MNRVKKKTYVSMSIENADSWTDEVMYDNDNAHYFCIHLIFLYSYLKEMADELWRRHLSRNDSKIVEIFHGQIKSVIKCLKCDKV